MAGKFSNCLLIDPFLYNYYEEIENGDIVLDIPLCVLTSQEFRDSTLEIVNKDLLKKAVDSA